MVKNARCVEDRAIWCSMPELQLQLVLSDMIISYVDSNSTQPRECQFHLFSRCLFLFFVIVTLLRATQMLRGYVRNITKSLVPLLKLEGGGREAKHTNNAFILRMHVFQLEQAKREIWN